MTGQVWFTPPHHRRQQPRPHPLPHRRQEPRSLLTWPSRRGRRSAPRHLLPHHRHPRQILLQALPRLHRPPRIPPRRHWRQVRLLQSQRRSLPSLQAELCLFCYNGKRFRLRDSGHGGRGCIPVSALSSSAPSSSSASSSPSSSSSSSPSSELYSSPSLTYLGTISVSFSCRM